MSYNGYTNWETWNVALWLDNDESYYNETRGMTADELERFVTSEFVNSANSGKSHFGDIDTEEELEQVNWEEVAEAHND